MPRALRVSGGDAVIHVGDNIDAFWRHLSDVGRKQVPFAAALAINDTAKDVKDAEETELDKKIDRPTPFTKRFIYLRRASKTRLTAWVGIKDRQAGYLFRQIAGGTRFPNGSALLIPVGQRVNQYGNLPRSTVARLMKRPDVFVASSRDPRTKHLRPGIYQRPSKRLRRVNAAPKLLIAFEDRAEYRPRIRFDHVAERRAGAVFERHFMRRLAQAIRTAR